MKLLALGSSLGHIKHLNFNRQTDLYITVLSQTVHEHLIEVHEMHVACVLQTNNSLSTAVPTQWHALQMPHIQLWIKIMMGCVQNCVIIMIKCAPCIRGAYRHRCRKERTPYTLMLITGHSQMSWSIQNHLFLTAVLLLHGVCIIK